MSTEYLVLDIHLLVKTKLGGKQGLGLICHVRTAMDTLLYV